MGVGHSVGFGWPTESFVLRQIVLKVICCLLLCRDHTKNLGCFNPPVRK